MKDNGQLESAYSAYRRALELEPNNATIHSNLIFSLHFHPATTEADLAEECERWNERHVEPYRCTIVPHTNSCEPQRRLRVGYVSPDLRAHPISYFLAPLLKAHKHAQLEIYCYSSDEGLDEVTIRLRESSDHWRQVQALTPREIASAVRADGIDILIDLAMHTDGSLLEVFAHKPAPVQVSWLAYPGSTRMPLMDYRLSDAYMDPPEVQTTENAHEAPIRLPDAWCCYAPLHESPPVSRSPAADTGIVTFASLNQFGKVNAALLRCWTQILAALPNARLLMICPEGSARNRVRDVFNAASIAVSRLEFAPHGTWTDYLAMFQRIDVALDCFPCNGMTTTCHSLWMGVPVVSRSGETTVSRAGKSLLNAVGLPELAVESEKDYIEAAIRLASDITALGILRQNLRERMQSSRLMDGARFAQNVEAAYRQMWRAWCEKGGSK